LAREGRSLVAFGDVRGMRRLDLSERPARVPRRPRRAQAIPPPS
jgi:hypothetical protein